MERTGLFVFGIVALVAIAGFALQSARFTGAYSWLTPHWRSCSYTDQDRFGECVRIEKHEGPCDPPANATPYRGRYGWLLRPCAPAFGTDKF